MTVTADDRTMIDRSARRELVSIDVLRAVAALAVVAFHVRLLFGHENVVLWSIVVEVQLYFAIRLRSPRRMTLWRWTIAFVAFGLAYHLVVAFVPLPAFVSRVMNPRFFAPARMGEWLCGAIVADAFVRRAVLPKPAWLAIGGTALVLATRTLTIVAGLDRYAIETLDAIGFALLVAGVVDIERGGWIAGRMTVVVAAIALIDERCYSLYLFNLPTLRWTSAALASTSVTRMPTIAAAITMTFLVAEIAYRAIELPSHRLARRLGRRFAVR